MVLTLTRDILHKPLATLLVYVATASVVWLAYTVTCKPDGTLIEFILSLKPFEVKKESA